MPQYFFCAYVLPIYVQTKNQHSTKIIKGGLGFTWIHAMTATQDRYIIQQTWVKYQHQIQTQLNASAKYRLSILQFKIKQPYLQFGVDLKPDYQNLQFITNLDQFIQLANQKFK